MDTVILSFNDIVSTFEVSAGAVRAWIASGKLVPVVRSGRGRGGAMMFPRGAVVGLVYGRCLTCGEQFRRVRLSQNFCSSRCRVRYSRATKASAAASAAAHAAVFKKMWDRWREAEADFDIIFGGYRASLEQTPPEPKTD